MKAILDSDSAAILRRLSRVPSWFAAWEHHLSRFGSESELTRLNATSARCVRVSSTLARALSVAVEAARWTGGAITPTILAALERAGYDRTFEELPAEGQRGNAPVEHLPFDYRDIQIDSSACTVERPTGLRLDLGGTAKGWSADRAAAALGRRAPALVSAGGDVAVSGPKRDGGPWLVSVPHPLRNGEEIALLAIGRGGVATSGRDRRRWQVGGEWRHHVIDPRTQAPAVTDVLSATVVGESACHAEVAAKMMLLLGVRAGLSWLTKQPGLAGIVVDDAGRAEATRNLEPYLVV